MSDSLRMIQRALLSVSDKTDLVPFAQALVAQGVELISTGGTCAALRQAGLPVKDVSEVTGFPEMMDGRLKTLHPKIHGGLLAIRENQYHVEAMRQHGIVPIDLLVVNLYPFEATMERKASREMCIENIDIGGPAMIRGAAKNHQDVTIVVGPEDYARVLAALHQYGGATPLSLRRSLAQKAYARTAAYDAAISNWLADVCEEEIPPWRAVGGSLIEAMRYGENPHQSAGFYRLPGRVEGVTTAQHVQGKELSYNNINDTDAAFNCVAEFDPSQAAAVAIMKHANPCGVAQAASLKEAYIRAFRCDPVSAFGGIVALNRPLDAEVAQEIIHIFTEVIIAPGADAEALAILAQKKNLRVLLTQGLPDPRARGLGIRSVSGGLLVQEVDHAVIEDMDLKIVTKRAPSPEEMADLTFAMRVAKHVKSNAIVYAKEGASVGIGAGQMSRVDSARIAAWKAEEAAKAMGLSEPLTKGSVVASDAFFPFADGLLAAVKAGATAVIQPGGSMRDAEVIAAADQAGLAMVFTGHRHFRH